MLMNGHALLAHFAHQRFAEHGVEARQRMLFAQEQLDFAAELAKCTGELAGHVAAADDGHPLRPLLEFEKAVRQNAELRSRHQRQNSVAAGGDHDMARRQTFTVYFHGVLVEEAGNAPHDGHALGLEVAFIDAVQAEHVGIALCLQGRPIIAADRDVEAVVLRVTQALGHARRIPHDLFRHASHVHACAAQAVRFDHGGFGAVFGRALRAGQAAAAAADADEIEYLVRHHELHAERPQRPMIYRGSPRPGSDAPLVESRG